MLSAKNVVLSTSRFLNDETQYCYNTHKLIYNLIDFWKQHRKIITLFYAVNFVDSDVIFDMSMLHDEIILVDSTKTNWRFKINSKRLTLENSKEFAKSLINQHIVYTLICVDVNKSTQKNFTILKISKKVKNFEKQFDDKKTDILLKQKNNYYTIDLIENKKSSFMTLYNLFQTKLTELRRYLKNVLIKNWIKYFVSLVDASILFVSKKNDELRLCVNYKKLNAITIKNQHSLFLITKTLNRLNDVKKFIKLNLKNVYYRIRIKYNNKWKTTFRTRYNYFEY